jgi:hypothetical protein
MSSPNKQNLMHRTVAALGGVGWRRVRWWILGIFLIVAAGILGIAVMRSPIRQLMPPGLRDLAFGGDPEIQMDRDYWTDVDAKIAKCSTQADFIRLWSAFTARQERGKSAGLVDSLQRFFKAWFAADLDGALKGVALIPEPLFSGFDTVFLRTEALVIGGESRFTEAPEKFFKAASDLLPETAARSAKEGIARVIAIENPVGLFQYIEGKLGQGYEKTDALRVLFSIWARTNPREAINHVGKLSFEEDRRSAFDALAWRSLDWSPDDVRFAEKAGMSGDPLARAWQFQKSREEYRKKWGVEMPKEAGP